MYTVVTRDNCQFCEKAKAILDEKEIPYRVINLQSLENRWLLNLIRSAGFSTVPQVWDKDGTHLGGYSELKSSLSD
jgi:glutaredoxin